MTLIERIQDHLTEAKDPLRQAARAPASLNIAQAVEDAKKVWPVKDVQIKGRTIVFVYDEPPTHKTRVAIRKILKGEGTSADVTKPEKKVRDKKAKSKSDPIQMWYIVPSPGPTLTAKCLEDFNKQFGYMVFDPKEQVIGIKRSDRRTGQQFIQRWFSRQFPTSHLYKKLKFSKSKPTPKPKVFRDVNKPEEPQITGPQFTTKVRDAFIRAGYLKGTTGQKTSGWNPTVGLTAWAMKLGTNKSLVRIILPLNGSKLGVKFGTQMGTFGQSQYATMFNPGDTKTALTKIKTVLQKLGLKVSRVAYVGQPSVWSTMLTFTAIFERPENLSDDNKGAASVSSTAPVEPQKLVTAPKPAQSKNSPSAPKKADANIAASIGRTLARLTKQVGWMSDSIEIVPSNDEKSLQIAGGWRDDRIPKEYSDQIMTFGGEDGLWRAQEKIMAEFKKKFMSLLGPYSSYVKSVEIEPTEKGWFEVLVYLK